MVRHGRQFDAQVPDAGGSFEFASSQLIWHGSLIGTGVQKSHPRYSARLKRKEIITSNCCICMACQAAPVKQLLQQQTPGEKIQTCNLLRQSCKTGLYNRQYTLAIRRGFTSSEAPNFQSNKKGKPKGKKWKVHGLGGPYSALGKLCFRGHPRLYPKRLLTGKLRSTHAASRSTFGDSIIF